MKFKGEWTFNSKLYTTMYCVLAVYLTSFAEASLKRSKLPDLSWKVVLGAYETNITQKYISWTTDLRQAVSNVLQAGMFSVMLFI